MGKHSIEKKKINFGKGFIAVIILVLIIAVIIGIIYIIKNNTNSNNEFEEQGKIINSAFSNLKSFNIDEVEKYLNYSELISGLDKNIMEEKFINLQKNLFNTMEWSIENIKEEDGIVVAIVEVTNKNYKNIIIEWLKQIVELKSETEELSNEESLQVLEKILRENNNGTQSVIKKIQLMEQDGEWKINVDDELINLVYPGIEAIDRVL